LRDWEERDVWVKAGGLSSATSTPTATSIGLKRLPMAVGPGKKKGACIGKTKRG
jgi:hypothetical protein